MSWNVAPSPDRVLQFVKEFGSPVTTRDVMDHFACSRSVARHRLATLVSWTRVPTPHDGSQWQLHQRLNVERFGGTLRAYWDKRGLYIYEWSTLTSPTPEADR